MSRKEIYKVLKKDEGQYEVIKADFDFEYTGKYSVSRSIVGTSMNCECFAGSKAVCRHRTMVPLFEELERCDSSWWYNFDTGKWLEQPKVVE